MPFFYTLRTFQKIVIIFILSLCIQESGFAQDTIPVPAPVKKRFKAEPMRATMLAVAFPGLGQIYNRSYWKIPLVYAGFGGLIYSAHVNSTNYELYMKAYQDFTDAIPETKSYQALIKADPSTYDPVLYPETYNPSSASYYKDGMLRMVDYYKRYRDLSYIGIAGWYLLSVLDANVDASLFNYDISDNLDLAIYPSVLSMPGGFTGAGLNVGMTITF
jgi:hypothetical protein